MSWNCPHCFRANPDAQAICRGCKVPRSDANPQAAQSNQQSGGGPSRRPTQTPQPQSQSSSPLPIPRSGSGSQQPIPAPRPIPQPAPQWRQPQPTPTSPKPYSYNPNPSPQPPQPSPSTAWNSRGGEGEVIQVRETAEQLPIDYYKAATIGLLLIALAPLVLVIFLTLTAFRLVAYMLLPKLPQNSGQGCSSVLLNITLINVLTGRREPEPRLEIILRDDTGCNHAVLALGKRRWPQPSQGDRLRVTGFMRAGVLTIKDGINESTRTSLRMPRSPWRLALLGLIVLLGTFLIMANSAAPPFFPMR